MGLDVQASGAAKGWIDLEAGEAHVLGKGSKRRTVPVGRKAIDALRHWLSVRTSAGPVAKEPAPRTVVHEAGRP